MGSWFVNHESISWFYEPKIRKTSIFHELFFQNFKIMSASDICLSICYNVWIRLNEWDWLMKNKNSVECFGFFRTTSLHINVENYKDIACTFFVDVNTALNWNSYEENYSVIVEFINRCIFRCSLDHKLKHLFMITSQSYLHFAHNIRHYYLIFSRTKIPTLILLVNNRIKISGKG